MLKKRTSAHNRALSETGVGLRDPLNLNMLNPASYTSITAATQITELGFFYESSNYSTTDSRSTSASGSLSAISLWFRFSQKWAGTVGLAPYSIVEYNVLGSSIFDLSRKDLVNYTGSGGLSQLYVGNGFQLTKNLSMGFNAFYLFGSIDRKETILSGEFSGLSLTEKSNYGRAGIDVGAQYQFNLGRDRLLTLGATAANKRPLRTTSTRTLNQLQIDGSQDSLFTSFENRNRFTLPLQVSGGVSFQTPKHLVLADATFNEWAADNNTSAEQTFRTSLAYEYKPRPVAEDFWRYIRPRVGVYTENTYYELKNQPLTSWGFTTSLGIPFAGNRGQVNLTYGYNSLGTTQRQLILQRSNVVQFDFVFRDIWGVRRKFD